MQACVGRTLLSREVGIVVAEQDKVIRAMTDDGSFRVIVVNASHTCREVCRRQKATGSLAVQLSELVTGAVVVRETMAPRLRAQAMAVGRDNASRLVADVYPDGSNRALVQHSEGDALQLGDGALLQIMRALPSGNTHEGIVNMASASSLSDAFMGYMHSSEQVNCVIQVAASLQGEKLSMAGGYIVQLLPEATRDTHMIMTERLDDFPDMQSLMMTNEHWVESVLDELLFGMAYTKLSESTLSFACQCSEARVMSSLAALDRNAIEEIVDQGQVVDVGCDYCGQNYSIMPHKLRSLLSAN